MPGLRGSQSALRSLGQAATCPAVYHMQYSGGFALSFLMLYVKQKCYTVNTQILKSFV